MQILGESAAPSHWCVWCDINVRQFDFETCVSVYGIVDTQMNVHRQRPGSGPAQMEHALRAWLPSVSLLTFSP
jgi:hypothetical protein